MPTLKESNKKLSPVEIRKGLGLSQERLSRLLGVSSKSINRWETDNTLPKDSAVLKRLAKLKEIRDLGLMVYTPEGLKEFLFTPLPIFAGQCALDLLQLGDYEPIVSVLASDLEGIGF
ncbi:helix-turn-helix domain-containing protein [Gloeocapsa sp. PCC 73106]|uniref:helix-turn-helix domain-containing protein n=1 Tax=Gloeocapsa sp. PCC 73106 TaxID=102232 RepID=UPI0002ACA664|nr:helix-turn-helix domain-containing protein [Gloeocapsa sp. PCC 73106]ELR98413.1 putative transcriptional regulator [Gloeocapsa sp. PCC 73106]